MVPLSQRRRLQVPECVQNLDLDLVEEVLTRHEGHAHNAAIELGVPLSALRKLTWAIPRLQDVAFTETEHLLDDAEAVVRQVVRGGNIERALRAAALVLIRHRGGRARGYISAANEANEDTETDAETKNFAVRWGGPETCGS